MHMSQTYSIEQALIEWLEGMGYDAYSNVPKDRPDEFVTVERTGGYVEDMVDHPVIAIQTWSQSAASAEKGASDIRMAAILGDVPDGVHSMRVNSGPYKFYDEESMQPRYQTVYDVACQLVI